LLKAKFCFCSHTKHSPVKTKRITQSLGPHLRNDKKQKYSRTFRLFEHIHIYIIRFSLLSGLMTIYTKLTFKLIRKPEALCLYLMKSDDRRCNILFPFFSDHYNQFSSLRVYFYVHGVSIANSSC